MQSTIRRAFTIGGFLAVTFLPTVGFAEDYASAERSAAALGHYARSRALLVEAIQEFERGKKLASPELLLDGDQWRLTIISRAEELNRVIDPKPRITRSGVRYRANSSLIRHDLSQRGYTSIPEASNVAFEDKKESKQSPDEGSVGRARMKDESTSVPAQPQAKKSEVTKETKETPSVKPAAEDVGTKATPKKKAEAPKADDLEEYETEIKAEDDPEVAAAIEAAIQERLKQLEQMTDESSAGK